MLLPAAAAAAIQSNAEKCYSSYEELAADTEIDAIYIATPHRFHYENIKLCMEAGKAVLCEKPFTVNANQAEELFEPVPVKAYIPDRSPLDSLSTDLRTGQAVVGRQKDRRYPIGSINTWLCCRQEFRRSAA